MLGNRESLKLYICMYVYTHTVYMLYIYAYIYISIYNSICSFEIESKSAVYMQHIFEHIDYSSEQSSILHAANLTSCKKIK